MPHGGMLVAIKSNIYLIAIDLVLYQYIKLPFLLHIMFSVFPVFKTNKQCCDLSFRYVYLLILSSMGFISVSCGYQIAVLIEISVFCFPNLVGWKSD
jgi:hypothetical protein